ncbi:hypothetical protein SMF913_12977 [Streptomyces malaysiensis]|uniref:Uncharacterized protein n=1 Tax=Streptomyces malaysiensis TaxID=92644 RepID=A0A2J7Z9L1_STRMQ|nr:hypothetical protein SMF913_12977 [Streptomyces malaysiensis]
MLLLQLLRLISSGPASVPLAATRVTDRLTALRRVLGCRLTAECVTQGGVQLLRFHHRQHQRCQGCATGSEDLKRQLKQTVFARAQTAPRCGTDLPAF